MTSPATARTRSRYGDGSRHSLASTSSRRSCGGGVVTRAHERDDLAVAGLEQAGEDLHAEEAGRAGQEHGRLHATASSATGARAVPIAWKPPSTCRISPVIARARSREQEHDRAGDRRRVVGVPAQRRLALPGVGEVAEARDAARGQRPERAGGDEVHAHAARPEVARQVARRRLERRLGHAHPVVDRPGDRGVEVEPDDARALLGVAGRRAPAASAFSENALVRNAVSALSGGVSRKLPPSASSGANAIACSDAVDARPSARAGRPRQPRGRRRC